MPVLIYSMPFVMSQNQKMQGCQRYGVQRIKAFFANKKSSEKGLGHLFIASSSSHFFKKTVFKQYLFEQMVTLCFIHKGQGLANF